jgi:UDP-glucuronate decarboxylase
MNSPQHLFVTGGTGFFGRALLRNWLDKIDSGATVPLVTVLTRSPDAFLKSYPEFSDQPWLHFHSGDVCKPQTLPTGTSFTHVLHAAAESTFGPQLMPLQRYDQIVNGTRNLLDFAVACGARRFLLTSSGGVYGVQPSHLDCIPEDWHGIPDPLNPDNAYSIAKRAAEHLCALYGRAYGLHTVVARCFSFVGQDLPLDVHFAIGNFIRDALWRDALVIAGDGTPQRSYLDQRDLANWLLVLLEKGRAGQAYNVGSDQAISITNLAHLVRDIIAPTKPISTLARFSSNNERNIYIPSVRKVREELGLEVEVSLAEAILAAANSAMQRSSLA